MRDNLVVGGITLAVLLGTAGIVAVVVPKTTHIPEVTCRILEADPEFFQDRKVTVLTDGFQSVDGGTELVYRKRADTPPVVILRLKVASEKIPLKVTGVCLGRQNGVVVVADCTP